MNKLRQPTKLHLLLLSTSLLLAGVLFVAPGKAQAASCGATGAYVMGVNSRDEFCGYFYNHYVNSGGFVLSNGIGSTDLTSFESDMKSALSSDPTGSSFIIRTMLGDPASSGKVTTTNCKTDNTWCRWKTLVESYDGAGLADYSYSYHWTCNQQNTYYAYDSTAKSGDVYAYTETASSSSSTPCGSNKYVTTIAFFSPADPTTPIYMIKKNCGNPIGTLTPPPALVTVQAHAFVVDSAGNKIKDVSGAKFVTCASRPETTADKSGMGYSSVGAGAGYCVRIASDSPAVANADGPYVRPWSEGYGSVCPTAYGWSGSNPYQDGNLQDHCAQTTYECQVAGTNRNSMPQCSQSKYDYDRNSDGGFDFIYVLRTPSCSINPSPTTIVAGNSTTISWSSSNATSMTITVGGVKHTTLSGTASDSPASSTTYTGSVSGTGGSGTCTGNVTVLSATGCSPSPAFVAKGSPVTLSASGGDTTATYSWTGGGSPSTGTGTSFTTTYATAGVYTATVTNSNISASCVVYVVDKPYFRAFAGDTLAGVGFANPDGSCSTLTANKRQLGFTSGSAPYAGAGNGYANFATGPIVEFVSGLLEPGPNNPVTFAFANNIGGYGGSFGTHMSSACATNYYSQAASLSLTPVSDGTTVPGASGNYSYTGNLNLSGSTVPSGVRATLYVDGDVFIGGDIKYQNATTGYGANPGQVPQFKLIVRGNIYVAPGVSELNGIYVAQPDISNARGGFYTCGFDNGGGSFRGPNYTGDGSLGNPFVSSELIGTCAGRQLTVYGAVVSRDVHLLRTYGSLGAPEINGTTTNAAERFIYTPDTWFNGQPSNSGKFQSYTALPPIL